MSPWIQKIVLACVALLLLAASIPISVAQQSQTCPVENRFTTGEASELCANFTHTPSEPTVQDTVVFDASSSFNAGGGGIDTYRWYNLDDEGAPNHYDAEGVTVSTSFDTPGERTIVLEIGTFYNSFTQAYEKEIDVVNTPPNASLRYSPNDPIIGKNITFDATDSYDVEYGIQSYEWTLDTGKTSDGKFRHSYDTYGSYNVTLTVSDGDLTSTKTETIVVDNNPPEPVIKIQSIPDRLTIKDRIVVNASGSYDVEAQELQVTDLQDKDGVGIEEYTWEFGDGTTKTGSIANHSYSSPGNYSIELTASDGRDSSSTTTEVRVINREPNARFTYSPREVTRRSDTIKFNASGTSDPDGKKNIQSYNWRVDNGETKRGEIVEFTYEELGAGAGEDTPEVTLTVDDGRSEDSVTKDVPITYSPGAQSADGFGVVPAVASLVGLVLVIRIRGRKED
jgi:PKD repeat protein